MSLQCVMSKFVWNNIATTRLDVCSVLWQVQIFTTLKFGPLLKSLSVFSNFENSGVIIRKKFSNIELAIVLY